MRTFPFACLLIGGLIAAAASAQEVPRDEAGFTEYAAGLFRKELGDSAVVVKSPLTLVLGELQANLDRVFVYCRNNSSGCAVELDRYVKGAAQIHRERNAPPAKESVRIVIRTVQYTQAANASTGAAGAAPLQPRPFVEGLVALPVVDTPRAIRMLGEKDNTALGLSADAAFDLGLANLRQELRPLMDVAKVAGKGQIGQLVGDSYHPSRLLLQDTWAPLAKAQGGVLIVAAPATDTVIYISEDTPLATDALRALARNVMVRAPNRLSDTLMRWRETGWEVLPP